MPARRCGPQNRAFSPATPNLGEAVHPSCSHGYVRVSGIRLKKSDGGEGRERGRSEGEWREGEGGSKGDSR